MENGFPEAFCHHVVRVLKASWVDGHLSYASSATHRIPQAQEDLLPKQTSMHRTLHRMRPTTVNMSHLGTAIGS